MYLPAPIAPFRSTCAPRSIAPNANWISGAILLDDNKIGFFRAFGETGQSIDRWDKTSY